MKNIFIIIILYYLCGCASSSQKLGEEDFYNLLQRHSTEIFNEARVENHEIIEKTLLSILDSIPNYDKQVIEDNRAVVGLLYFNLACYQSLQGKKKEAVQSFAKAIDNDYVNYSEANADSDLDNIRGEKKFQELLESIRRKGDYLQILKASKDYNNELSDSLPTFIYMSAEHPDLVKLREYFNLDSIAGNGDEISKIKNLLFWIHEVVPHDGSSMNPKVRNAIDMVNLCQEEDRGINCRMMALALNECYLAMGFKSRYVTCMPKEYVTDCHVINSVYSETLGKWLWVDPTYNAYVMDENGNMLGIHEVRERLKDGKPLVLNEDANWNNLKKQTKEFYLDYYMAKNLYYIVCPVKNEFNNETYFEGKEWTKFISLIPENFKMDEGEQTYYITSNPDYFWARPN